MNRPYLEKEEDELQFSEEGEEVDYSEQTVTIE